MLRSGTPPPEVGALARALGGGLEPELLFGIGGGTGFGRFGQSLLSGVASAAQVAAARDAEQGSLETIERAFQLSV